MFYRLESVQETCTGLHEPQIHLSLSNLLMTPGPSCGSSWHSIPVSLLITRSQGPALDLEAKWHGTSCTHPVACLRDSWWERGGQSQGMNHQTRSAAGARGSSWDPGAPFLGRTSLKSGWAVKGWVTQSTRTSLVAPCGSWSPHTTPWALNALVLCREWQ